MKINRIALLGLLCIMILPVAQLQAQSSREIIRHKVNQGLQEYLKKVYPPKNCKHNDSRHFYTSKMQFTKNMKVGNTLRLWGKAGVTYRNARTGGNKSVEFYAEMVKINGEIELSKLKWRVGACMKFETLYLRK